MKNATTRGIGSSKAAAVGLLLGWSLTANATPGVIVFPSLARRSHLELKGIAVREMPHGSHALTKNMRALTERGLEKKRVSLTVAGRQAAITTDDDGRFDLSLSGVESPFQVGFHDVQATVDGGGGTSRVQVLDDRAPFLVVSDFDDTLAVTDVPHTSEMLESALLKDATTQPSVSGMAQLFQCLRAQRPIEPGFALVTGSPEQFGPRIQQFLESNGFPFLGLYLRRFKPSNRHGYKQPVIRKLLKEFPLPMIGFGDSGEQDPEVYRQIRSEFPTQVKAIYIRKVTPTKDPHRFDGMLAFTEVKDAAADLVQRGFADAECVKAAFGAPK